jgi:selenocysteine-specific elongation factor
MTAVRIYVGTKEAVGKVALLEGGRMEPGQEGYVQLRSDEPLVVDAGDRFLLRLQSPMVTIGGGQVLAATEGRRRRFAAGEVPEEFRRRQEALGDRRRHVEVELAAAGPRLLSVEELAHAVHQPLDFCRRLVEELRGTLLWLRPDRFIHPTAFAGVQEAVAAGVERFHKAQPLKAGIPKLQLLGEMKLPEELVEAALAELLEAGRLAVENDRVRRAGFEPQMSREDAQVAALLEQKVRAAGFATPNTKELLASLGTGAERARRVLGVLLEKGSLIQLADGVLLHADVEREARRKVEEELRQKGTIEPGRAKDLLGTSRKYVIPLLERFDEIGLTVRQGNVRLLKK